MSYPYDIELLFGTERALSENLSRVPYQEESSNTSEPSGDLEDPAESEP